jgi:hypothetical protein
LNKTFSYTVMALLVSIIIPAYAGTTSQLPSHPPAAIAKTPSPAEPREDLHLKSKQYWQNLGRQQEAIIRKYWKPCASIMC